MTIPGTKGSLGKYVVLFLIMGAAVYAVLELRNRMAAKASTAVPPPATNN